MTVLVSCRPAVLCFAVLYYAVLGYGPLLVLSETEALGLPCNQLSMPRALSPSADSVCCAALHACCSCVHVLFCFCCCRPQQPWLYLGTASSHDCAALQPLPAPAAGPVASFNPHLPLTVDVDTLLADFKPQPQPHPASNSGNGGTQAHKQKQERRELLQQQLVCGGQQLPAAAAEALVQGGIARSLLLLQRTPQLAVQLLVQGQRLLYALPLMLFSGEPVRLVLLLELYTSPPAAVGPGGQQQQQQGGLLYCSQGVAPFAAVYPAMRALGPCDWVSWVKEAVEALQQQQQQQENSA